MDIGYVEIVGSMCTSLVKGIAEILDYLSRKVRSVATCFDIEVELVPGIVRVSDFHRYLFPALTIYMYQCSQLEG